MKGYNKINLYTKGLSKALQLLQRHHKYRQVKDKKVVMAFAKVGEG